ncbi:MAG: TIGR00730 family Rossman fold protein [Betaproteobacteria bacterium]|nr:TIGR00730 family Rossman fold protein [Betaproteobacteria bacterium]
MNSKVNSVTVFCGARSGADARWERLACEVGAGLAQRGLALVFGGGRNGLMGAVAQAVIDGGGKTTGVIPESLLSIEPAKDGLTELFIVDSMHTRKFMMSERADAFLVLPGGIGTLEEFFETWTWRQLGLHAKPIVLLNAFDYYTPMLKFLAAGAEAGFIRAEHRDHISVATTVSDALKLLSSPA